MTQLDIAQALKARDEGIAQVASHNQTFLETARGIARLLCQQRGTITGDDVRAECERRGVTPSHTNAYGAVFKSREFEAVGIAVSKRVAGHGNRVMRWRLRT